MTLDDPFEITFPLADDVMEWISWWLEFSNSDEI
jgi:hypothetical protein